MKIPTTGNVIDVTGGLFGLVLIGSGAGIGTTTRRRRAQSTSWKQRPEISAKRQNATWRHSRCGRDQQLQRSKLRPSSWTSGGCPAASNAEMRAKQIDRAL